LFFLLSLIESIRPVNPTPLDFRGQAAPGFLLGEINSGYLSARGNETVPGEYRTPVGSNCAATYRQATDLATKGNTRTAYLNAIKAAHKGDIQLLINFARE